MSNGKIQYERKAAGKFILKRICIKTVNSYSKKTLFLRRQRISVLKEHQNIASLKQIHIFPEAVCSQNIVLSISVSGQRSENNFPLSKNCGFYYCHFVILSS